MKKQIIYSQAGSENNENWTETWNEKTKTWKLEKEAYNQYEKIQQESRGSSLKELIEKYSNGEIPLAAITKPEIEWEGIDTTKIPEDFINQQKLLKEIKSTTEKYKNQKQKNNELKLELEKKQRWIQEYKIQMEQVVKTDETTKK